LRKTKIQTTFSILVLNTPLPPPIINVVPRPGVISSSSTLTTGGGKTQNVQTVLENVVWETVHGLVLKMGMKIGFAFGDSKMDILGVENA
jgi:hypothetical protein